MRNEETDCYVKAEGKWTAEYNNCDDNRKVKITISTTCTGRTKKYPLKNLAIFSRTIESYETKFYTLVTHSIICKYGNFRSIIYIIDKITLLLVVATSQLRCYQQETQLSLTKRATRLKVSQGHQTWYHSIC